MRNLSLALLSAALMLGGCASSGDIASQEGIAAFKAGDMSTAKAKFETAIQSGSPAAWNNMGVFYEANGQKDMAIRYYTMGARRGDPKAQENLVKLGAPVPFADLRGSTPESGAEVLGGAVLEGAHSYQQGRNLAPRYQPGVLVPESPKNCTTSVIGQQAYTRCQ